MIICFLISLFSSIGLFLCEVYTRKTQPQMIQDWVAHFGDSVLKGMVLRHTSQIPPYIPVEQQIHIVNGRIVH